MSERIIFCQRFFEEAIRRELNKWEGAITKEDLLLVKEIDCCSYAFKKEDFHILCEMKNLEVLDFDGGDYILQNFDKFTNLKDLYIECKGDVDFSVFNCLTNLEELVVSGGSLSYIDFYNLDALRELKNLSSLALHEFGKVDLSGLKKLPNLSYFFCGWAKEVENIEAISCLDKLEELRLIYLDVEDLSFLKAISKSVILELGECRLKKELDLDIIKQFHIVNMEEVSVQGEYICDYNSNWDRRYS